ncbi:hypothetical protein Pcinc_029280, partial [Petrolisthes cinctipes]
NTWGVSEAGGEGAVGYGPQETFINCADISITTNTGTFPTGDDANQIDNPWLLYYRKEFPGVHRDHTPSPLSNGLIPLVVRSQLCIPVGVSANNPNMQDWCMYNCLQYPPNCPEEHCRCVSECSAIGEFGQTPGNDIFCQQECLGYPSNCPPEKCECA